jgi:hypothetical protein
MGDLMVEDTSAFIADMGPAYEDGYELAAGRCTGVLFSAGEDGMQTIDHDGPCEVHGLEGGDYAPGSPLYCAGPLESDR